MLAPIKAQIQLKKINHKAIRKKDRGPHLGLVSDEEDTTENIYPDKEPNIFEESIMAGETLKFGLFWCALPQKGSPPHLLPSASGLGTLTSPSPTIMCTNNRQTFL